MHLIGVYDPEENDPCGIALLPVGPGEVQDLGVAATASICGGEVFAHEVGHTMGLWHDRYQQGDNILNQPFPYSYGYVNQRAFDAGAPESSRWRTVMAYPDQCTRAGFWCTRLLRFSNPDQTYRGDPLGIPGNAPSTARPMPGGA